MRITPSNNQSFTSLKAAQDKMTQKAVLYTLSNLDPRGREKVADELLSTIKYIDDISGKDQYILRGTVAKPHKVTLSLFPQGAQKGQRGEASLTIPLENYSHKHPYCQPSTAESRINRIEAFKQNVIKLFEDKGILGKFFK